MEAISHAGTVLGILASDGVVLAAEKKVTSKLLEQDKSSEKIFQLSGNVLSGVAGMTADLAVVHEEQLHNTVEDHVIGKVHPLVDKSVCLTVGAVQMSVVRQTSNCIEVSTQFLRFASLYGRQVRQASMHHAASRCTNMAG